MRAFPQGDAAAFEQIYARHQAALYRFVRPPTRRRRRPWPRPLAAVLEALRDQPAILQVLRAQAPRP